MQTFPLFLGLYPFLKSVSFIMVPNTVTSALNLSDEHKNLLKVTVDRELRNNVASFGIQPTAEPNQ